jgi:hypothetical protein
MELETTWPRAALVLWGVGRLLLLCQAAFWQLLGLGELLSARLGIDLKVGRLGDSRVSVPILLMLSG